MSRRVPSGPSPRVTGRTEQIAVRVPLAHADAARKLAAAWGVSLAAVVRASIATTTTDPAAREAAQEALRD